MTCSRQFPAYTSHPIPLEMTPHFINRLSKTASLLTAAFFSLVSTTMLPAQPAGLAGDTRLDPVIGTWEKIGGEGPFILEMDGGVTSTDLIARWICTDPAQRKYEIKWTDKFSAFYTLSADGMSMSGHNSMKKPLNAKRIGPPPPPDTTVAALLGDKEGYRVWTDSKTGKTIEGRLVSKSANDSKAHIARKDNGKGADLIAADLLPVDQYYIKYWVTPDAQVTLRLTGHGNPGWKRVKATIQGGAEPLLVKVTGDVPPPDKEIAGLPRPPFMRVVAVGEKLEFLFGSGNNYSVEATTNGKTSDQESDKRKTGL